MYKTYNLFLGTINYFLIVTSCYNQIKIIQLGLQLIVSYYNSKWVQYNHTIDTINFIDTTKLFVQEL